MTRRLNPGERHVIVHSLNMAREAFLRDAAAYVGGSKTLIDALNQQADEAEEIAILILSADEVSISTVGGKAT